MGEDSEEIFGRCLMKKFLLALCLVLVCVVAVAQDVEVEAPSEIGQTIEWIVAKVFYAIGIALSVLIAKALSKLGKKYGIEIDENKQKLIQSYALSAIGYADEWARKKINIDKATVKAEEKFDKACEKLATKVPFLSEDMVKEAIVATLPKFRAMGSEKLEELLLERKDR